MTLEPHVTGRSDPDRISVELPARRAGMSFQRTRLSADRTLRSVMHGLRPERAAMKADGLMRGESVSLTLITALVLLAIGVSAIISMIFNVGPFG
jgi:hypothetical protein